MNLLRVFGAVLLIGAGSAWGYASAEELKRRPHHLSAFQRSLELIKSEVGYGLVSLPVVWERVAGQTDGAVSKVFRTAAACLRTGEVDSAQTAWERGLESQSAKLSLRNEDIEILLGLGPVLTLVSSEEQCRHLELICTRLRILESSAREEATRYAQLALQLGILGAVALTIVLW